MDTNSISHSDFIVDSSIIQGANSKDFQKISKIIKILFRIPSMDSCMKRFKMMIYEVLHVY